MEVKVLNGTLEEKEIGAYIVYAQEKYGEGIQSLEINVINDEEVELTVHKEDIPFERIRRITGYLVGTMDKWNDGKRGEEKDRVKHEFR